MTITLISKVRYIISFHQLPLIYFIMKFSTFTLIFFLFQIRRPAAIAPPARLVPRKHAGPRGPRRCQRRRRPHRSGARIARRPRGKARWQHAAQWRRQAVGGCWSRADPRRGSCVCACARARCHAS